MNWRKGLGRLAWSIAGLYWGFALACAVVAYFGTIEPDGSHDLSIAGPFLIVAGSGFAVLFLLARGLMWALSGFFDHDRQRR